jgi:hypothetical protein
MAQGASVMSMLGISALAAATPTFPAPPRSK